MITIYDISNVHSGLTKREAIKAIKLPDLSKTSVTYPLDSTPVFTSGTGVLTHLDQNHHAMQFARTTPSVGFKSGTGITYGALRLPDHWLVMDGSDFATSEEVRLVDGTLAEALTQLGFNPTNNKSTPLTSPLIAQQAIYSGQDDSLDSTIVALVLLRLDFREDKHYTSCVATLIGSRSTFPADGAAGTAAVAGFASVYGVLNKHHPYVPAALCSRIDYLGGLEPTPQYLIQS